MLQPPVAGLGFLRVSEFSYTRLGNRDNSNHAQRTETERQTVCRPASRGEFICRHTINITYCIRHHVQACRKSFDRNHALRLGNSPWGVQLHLEFAAATTRSYIWSRSDQIVAKGQHSEWLSTRSGKRSIRLNCLPSTSMLSKTRLTRQRLCTLPPPPLECAVGWVGLVVGR